MILVDRRVGCPRGENRMELAEQFAAKLQPSRVEELQYGDVAWEGHTGQLVGVEIKKINDAVSSMLSGRLADHQLPGMLQLYDYCYLIVEGYYRCDPESGLIQGYRGGGWRDIVSGRQRLTWQALDNWLTSIEALGGVRIRRTTTEAETVRTIQSLYGWWQKAEHRSLKVFNTAADAAAISRPGLVCRVAKELPMIGWERGIDVAKRFPTVRDLATADMESWLEIDGIGPGIAAKVWGAINGQQ